MVKVLMLIAQRNFNDTEFSVTKKTLEQNGIQVTVSSITTDDAAGMEGLRVKPNTALREANPNDYDAFVIIGGSGSPRLMDYPEVTNTVKKFNEQGKLVAAICLAPMVLAKAGILKGVLSTVFPADFAVGVLKRQGASYTEQHVVEGSNIITADGPEAAEEFANKILKKFNV
jgi:protease I